MRSSSRAEWLPPVLESPTLRERRRGTPVAAGAGDQPAAAVGVGVDAAGIALRRARHVGRRPRAAARVRARRRGARPRLLPRRPRHLAGDGRDALARPGSLQWLHDVVAPGVPFDELVAEADGWGPGAEGLLFLPYLAGERTPHADPTRAARSSGSQLRHDRGALVRAVLEGVAFGLRDSLDLLRALGVERAASRACRAAVPAAACGSGSSRPCSASRSSCTESEEGSAFGAALLGGVAAGVFADVARGGRRMRSRHRHGRAGSRRGRRLRGAARALPRAVSGTARR